MKRPVEATAIPVAVRPRVPEPYAQRIGQGEGRALADHFELDQFGMHLETLPPGAESALRHWHSRSDELVYVLAGELTLVTDDGEYRLTPGMCAGFKGGEANAHHLINRSASAARFLVVGTRHDDDQVHYPDDDFQWLSDGAGGWFATRRDGTPL